MELDLSRDKINNLEIQEYVLESSSEVAKIVSEIEVNISKNMVVHIFSIIHNTVLVQNLKLELTKRIENITIKLLKHKERTATRVVVYRYNADVEAEFAQSNILNEVCLENKYLEEDLHDCKIELLNGYFTDHLTHLPNLYQLRKDLADEDKHGLVSVVIDDFATINSYYGFIVGDFVIEQVANYLQENLKEKIYRVSGTEFAILLTKHRDYYALDEYINELYSKICTIDVMYQDSKIVISLTLASSSSDSNENIFSKVSMALTYAKNNKLPFWIYEDNMRFENEYEQNLDMSNKVRHAVQNLKIIPYFQAIIDNTTSEINKYECLARLMDEKDNVISPDLFIPIAKRIKVYNLVTKTIIDKSFESFSDNDFEFSINLSIDDIMNGDIYDFIINKLKNFPASKRVIFEIVESEAIQDFDKVAKFINEVKRYGAKIAIDDFGDGYSNFSYLIKMNVDYLKIDGSLIGNIDVDPNALLVVETIVEFSKKLGLEIIAEFVHSSTVMDKVKELGIQYSQGFYIDKPTIEI